MEKSKYSSTDIETQTELSDAKKLMEENLNKSLDEFLKFLANLMISSSNAAASKSYGDGGAVIALNGVWGSGKTTSLNIFKEKSKKDLFENKPVIISYNAWENDYFDDPLISLIGQIDDQYSINAESSTKISIKNFKEKGVSLLKNILEATAAVNSVAALVNQAVKIASSASADVMQGDFDDSISAYQALETTKMNFKDALAKLEPDKIKIIIIDELDRCNPLFAIKLLERIKHFFNIKNMIFLIAVDMVALASAMKVIYGSEYITEQYLSRFFDYELQLPHHELFYRDLVYKQFHGQEQEQNFIVALVSFFGIQPREQVKLCQYFSVLTKQVGRHQEALYLLLAIKFINRKKYHEIVTKQINANDDLEEQFQKFIQVIESISFKKVGLQPIHNQDIYASIIALFCIICMRSSDGQSSYYEKVNNFNIIKSNEYNVRPPFVSESIEVLNIFFHYLEYFNINTTTKFFRYFQMQTA